MTNLNIRNPLLAFCFFPTVLYIHLNYTFQFHIFLFSFPFSIHLFFGYKRIKVCFLPFIPSFPVHFIFLIRSPLHSFTMATTTTTTSAYQNPLQSSTMATTTTTTSAYQNVRRRRPHQKSSTVEYETLDSVKEPRVQSAIIDLPSTDTLSSRRSIQQRVPWSNRGWYHRCVQFSHVLSMSNMLKFPFLCAQHGGASFLIAYLTAYLFVGIPLLCQEMALGQFSSVPPIELFRKLSPSLSGIGIAMVTILMLRVVYFSAIASQAIYSAVLTIKGHVDGQTNCTFEGHSDLCFSHEYEQCGQDILNNRTDGFENFKAKCKGWMDGISETYANQFQFWRPPHLDYLATNVFQPIFTQDEWVFPWWLLLILASVWIVQTFLAYLDVRKLGTPFIFIKFTIVIALLVNATLSFIYDKKTDWGEFFTTADLSNLIDDFEVWADAIAHVLVSLSIGSGAVHKISSLSDFHENFLYNALIVSVVDMLFSTIMGISFFSALGAVAHKMYPLDEAAERIKLLLTHGFIISHTMFPEHMLWSMGLAGGTIFAFLHYIKISILLIPGMIVQLGIIRNALEEVLIMFYPRFIEHELILKRAVTVALGSVGFLSAIIFIGAGGFMIQQLWHEFCGYSVVLISLSEVIAISYHYGFRRYLANVQTMLQNDTKSNLLYSVTAVLYYFITPTLLCVTIVFKIVWNRRAAVLGYLFPKELEATGWAIVGSTFFIIFCPIIRYLIVSLRMRSGAHLFEPMSGWGPIEREEYEKNMRNERAASVRVTV